jgi:hypothetical protein
LLAAAALAEGSGHFVGALQFEWLRDGRNMRLLVPFGYVDSGGVNWDVPPGAVTDGASIPRVFWLLAGPFEGKYREAAVVHDYYCVSKSHSWHDTHLMFYHAMQTSGVDEVTAKTMYAAVYYFGPRCGLYPVRLTPA